MRVPLPEILPLVEFFIEDDIGDDLALQLIRTEPAPMESPLKNTDPSDDYQIYQHNSNGNKDADPFASYFYSEKVSVIEQRDQHSKIILNRDALMRLKPTEVIVCSWAPPLPNRYYRHFLPDVALKRCKHCNKVNEF